MLWEVALASSSAPTILPVLARQNAYYGDDGVSSFGNPAYIEIARLMRELS